MWHDWDAFSSWTRVCQRLEMGNSDRVDNPRRGSAGSHGCRERGADRHTTGRGDEHLKTLAWNRRFCSWT